MKKLLSTLLLTVVACTAYSQIVNFFGPTSSGLNETQSYSVTLFDEYPEYNQIMPFGGNWYVTGGAIVSSGNDDADIQWTSYGLNWLEYSYETWDDYYYGIYYVFVDAPTPNTTFGIVLNCNNTEVTRNSSPSEGLEWYWQTSSDGTSTALGSSSSIVRTSAGDLFLRAKLTASPYTWSPASQNAGSITIVTSTPSGGAITGGVTICSGTASPSISNQTSASGQGTITYQWENSSEGTSWSTISGATSESYSPGTVAVKYYYRRKASNQCGSVYTNTVIVDVYSSLSPGSINGTATICYNQSGGTLGEASAASGSTGSYTYQWQSSPNGSSWTNISGANSTTYGPGILTSTTVYRRLVSTSCGTVNSNSVTVTVNPQLNSGSIGSSQTICSGSSPATLISVANASGGNGSYGYQWQSSPDNSNWSDISGAISSTYSPGTLSSIKYYRRKVSSCSQILFSGVVIINVDAQSNSGTLSQSTEAFNNAGGTLAVSGVVGSIQKWQSRTGAGVWVDISNTTTSQTYNVSATTYYRVSVKSGVCSAVTSNEVSIIIDQAPTITTSTNRIALEAVTLDAGPGYNSYTWKNSANTVVGSNQTYSTFTPGSYTVTVTKSGVTGSGVSAAFSVLSQFNGTTLNYIVSNTIQIENVTTESSVKSLNVFQNSQSVQYFDGVGRPIQSVVTKGSPNKNDIVQPVVYDVFGREAIKYLPYTSGNDGLFKSNFLPKENSSYASASSPQYQFYQNTPKVAIDSKPYAETIFEPSPLNRVLEQGAPGVAWQPDATNSYTSTDRTIKKAYQFNSASEVLLWTYTAPSINSPNGLGLVNAGTAASPIYYAANQLIKNKTKDEQYNEVIEYVDKLGRTVLKRVQVVPGTPSINDTNYASTYYIYDDFGSLVCVIPPEAVSRLAAEYYHAAATNATKESFLKNWAFRYKYDGRKRMTQKQVPGAGQVYMVYDNRDRLVLTQDSVQRSGATNAIKYWTFTKYDELNRPILTGIKDTTTNVQLTQFQMQTVVDTYYSLITTTKPWRKYGETYVGNVTNNVHGYTNVSYPQVTNVSTLNVNSYLTATYYDNYTFRNLWIGSYNYLDENLSETANSIVYNEPDLEFLNLVGQVTGIKVKVLDGGVAGGFTWLKSVNYYDDHYRVIQALSDNYKGSTDRLTNVYDFTGKVLKSKTTHTKADVTWRDQLGTVVTGNKLTSTTSGLTGAASTQLLGAGQNGSLEFTVGLISSINYFYVGLNDSNPDAGFTNIDYAFYVNNGTLRVVENNTIWINQPNVLGPDDILKIERIGTSIKYYRNGTLLYTSATASSGALMADVSFQVTNATLVGMHTTFSTTSHSTTRRFEYDHAGRITKTWHQLDAQPEILLALNEYNELGQLVDKKLHSTIASGTDAKQSVDYRYNIRGWLKKVNESDLNINEAGDPRDLFGMELGYENDLGTGNTANLQFNGNINAIRWSNNLGLGSTKELGYNFVYDPMNRLQHANHKSYNGSTWTAGNYNENNLTYDLNGNIKTLQRTGDAGVQIDNLTYNYGSGTSVSNKLVYVSDGTVNATDKAKGFADGNTSGYDYTYDGNGNLLIDLNKLITSTITYNFLNLPEKIIRNNSNVTYIYDATGRKLAQVASFGGAQKQTEYLGEYVYENNDLQFLNHEEGRIMLQESKTVFTTDGSSATLFAPSANFTATTQVTNGETYVKMTPNVGIDLTKVGVTPIGGNISVTAGEKYVYRVKGYTNSTKVAFLYVKGNSSDIIWTGGNLPTNSVAEMWLENSFTIPAGVTQINLGVLYSTGTSAAGDYILINEVELKKISTATPEYQYNLKDHLGNVRLTFTSKVETITETATLETANATTEQSQFVRYAEARKIQSYLFDRTNGTSPTTNTGYSQRLSGSTNEKYGLGKSISVMPGDVISAEVYAKYVDPVSSNWTTALTTLMGYVANPGSAPAGTVVDGAGYSGSTASFPFPGAAAQNTAGSSESGPKAYLNWLVFDRNFNFILSESGYDRISSTPKETGQDVAHEKLFSPQITIKQAGYVYIYLSNEEPSPLEVYFDDFKVTQTKSPVIQMDDYYPFGLTFNSYSRENSLTNQYLYSGAEKQDELGLGWIDYGPRMYMPEIGRFNRIDIFSEMSPSSSGYGYAGNDPVNANDLGGNFKFPADFRLKYPRVTAYLEKVLPQLQNNSAIVNSLSKHNFLDKDVIKKDFQNGSGPSIEAGDFDVPHWGNNNVKGQVLVNAEGLLQQLENGLATNDPKYEEFTEVYKFMTIVTILHEYVHEGSKRTNKRLPRGLGGRDEGSNWEYEAFGRFIDYPTQKMAQDFDRYPDKAIGNTAQSYRGESVIFYQVITGSTSTENKKKKKPDADKEASKRSGGG